MTCSSVYIHQARNTLPMGFWAGIILSSAITRDIGIPTVCLFEKRSKCITKQTAVLGEAVIIISPPFSPVCSLHLSCAVVVTGIKEPTTNVPC